MRRYVIVACVAIVVVATAALRPGGAIEKPGLPLPSKWTIGGHQFQAVASEKLARDHYSLEDGTFHHLTLDDTSGTRKPGELAVSGTFVHRTTRDYDQHLRIFVQVFDTDGNLILEDNLEPFTIHGHGKTPAGHTLPFYRVYQTDRNGNPLVSGSYNVAIQTIDANKGMTKRIHPNGSIDYVGIAGAGQRITVR